MTLFRNASGCRNAQDFRVLLVGAICTILIFTFVTALEESFSGITPALVFQVDLVLQK